MKASTDIVIAGSGLNGMTLALALRLAGFSVTIVDPGKPNKKVGDFDGRSYAMALSSWRLLSALGLQDILRANAQPMLEIKVSDGKAGDGAAPFFVHFDHDEIEEGPMGYMVEDRHLRPALLNALAGSGVNHVLANSVVAHEPGSGGVTVELKKGPPIQAGLLIGCDGSNSATGERAGIERTQRDYTQTGLVTAVAHELPHNGIAHQFFMESGPLAILPLQGSRSSIVWTESESEAARIAALDDAGFLKELRPRFGEFLGDIQIEGKRASFPLGLSVANSFVAPRVALVGDAAHSLHPIAGQGLNAGLRDIGALTEVLTDARRRGEDFGRSDVLERYQRWRRFDTTTLALATDGFNRLFSNDNPGLRTLRDLGLGVVQSLPILKRGFIREAAGLTGDLPRLMRGLPL